MTDKQETEMKNETAKQAYTRNQDEISALMQKIQMALGTQAAELRMSEHETGNGANWAHVGSLADIKSKLQDISDQLTGEGEYAE